MDRLDGFRDGHSQGILDTVRMAYPAFWRPELNQNPPDMASLKPRWITGGLIVTFVLAGICDNIRSAFEGSGVVKGVKFGLVVSLPRASTCAGWPAAPSWPDMIRFSWALEGFIICIVAGALLYWFAERCALSSPCHRRRISLAPAMAGYCR